MKSTILIIDDDQLNTKIISARLVRSGYEVLKALDGDSGIKVAIEVRPDLILLDVLMPQLNGFETCIILKEKVETDKIPVIFLTALADLESIKKAFKVGAVDYVTKPIEFDGLLARIETHLKLKRMNESLEIEVTNKTRELISANETLQKLVEDKEILLKELFHRTKNNMMIICSMLSLQSNYTEDEDLSKILIELKNKIESMALVHKKLYQSNDLSNIEMKEYITDLVELIQLSYENNPGKITVDLDLNEIYVSIDTAVSCGLIINELLSNSFKYAFPDDKKGLIKIRIKQFDDKTISMKIEDNGIGNSNSKDFSKMNTLGIRTVTAIAKHQLQGEAIFKTEQGISCELIFRDNI